MPGTIIARNEYGSNDGPVPNAPDNTFSIVVDQSLRPNNFISTTEDYHRKESIKPDTTVFPLIIPGWQKMSPVEKITAISKEKVRHTRFADSVHKNNNKDQLLIYFINKTDTDVYIAMQDWQFMGVLEALDRNKQWRSIEYWQQSTCGNSYFKRPVKAHASAVFIAPSIKKGDYKTRLRYRVLGADGVFYSREFEAGINYMDLENTQIAQQQPAPVSHDSFLDSKIDLPISTVANK